MIDAHCHLCAKDFDQDLDQVIAEAKSTGVKACLVVAEHHGEFQKIMQMHERYPDFIMACLGVHPVQEIPGESPRSVNLKDLENVESIIDQYSDQIVAVGEIGLDFTPRFCPNDDSREIQRQVLRHQITIAKKHNLPINVHSRSAGRPTIQLLKEQGVTSALLHAFDGKPSVAMDGVNLGYYFSIPPSIIRSEQQKLVERLPLDNIILETDSPALGPEKQVRNTPSNITITCEYIAKIKKLDIETVKRVTTENALKLFPKLKRFVVI